MTKDYLSFIQKLKSYHIILLACILCLLLIINSNRLNEKRAKENLYKEKKKIFDKIISTRKLDENLDESPDDMSDIDKICERGSDDLKKYYVTGDLKEIGLKEEDGIECKEKNKNYFKSLINIIRIATGEDDEEDEEELRNLEMDFNAMKDDIIIYVKHMLPIFILFVIGILSLPGWPICCFCCCCNCCCCCCCKKPGCRIPCFIFTYIFYALSVAICLYGLTQANKIFVGLADTECSMLRFFEQILDGEIKQDTPRWPGIEGIDEILGDINNEIEKLRTGTLESLNIETEKIDEVKKNFIDKMHEYSKNFSSEDCFEYYTDEYSPETSLDQLRKLKGYYVLDLVKFFGKEENGKYIPENSILDIWEKEYDIVSQNADKYLSQANDTFQTVCDESSGDIINSLNEGRDSLNEIKESFNDIRSEIEGMLFDSSELIDKYGKLGVKAAFGVLALINIALAVFVLFICLFSGKMCTNCCCCRCIFKFLTHFFWNILALLAFIVFMLGFIFSLIGTIGYDTMSVISYVLSKENMEDENGVLVNELGDSKKYLDKCINGDGKILDLLEIDTDQLDSFDNMTEIEDQINSTKNEFEDKKAFVTYSIYIDQLNSRVNLTSEELMLIKSDFEIDLNKVNEKEYQDDNKNNILVFKSELDIMNTLSPSEKWEKGSPTVQEYCKNGQDVVPAGITSFNLWSCKPLYRDWIENMDDDVQIKKEAKILTDTLNQINKANDENDDRSIKKALNILRFLYEIYLDQYILTLDGFQGILENITKKLKKYINTDEGLFSFIDGKFIKTNLKVMLKYLKSILGGNVKTIGFCLSIVGCSLILSISSTILLIVIINITIDENKEKEIKEQQKEIPEYQYQFNSGGRIIQYQNN